MRSTFTRANVPPSEYVRVPTSMADLCCAVLSGAGEDAR